MSFIDFVGLNNIVPKIIDSDSNTISFENQKSFWNFGLTVADLILIGNSGDWEDIIGSGSTGDNYVFFHYWYKKTEASDQRLLNLKNSSSANVVYIDNKADGTFEFFIDRDTTDGIWSTTESLELNKWYLLTINLSPNGNVSHDPKISFRAIGESRVDCTINEDSTPVGNFTGLAGSLYFATIGQYPSGPLKGQISQFAVFRTIAATTTNNDQLYDIGINGNIISQGFTPTIDLYYYISAAQTAYGQNPKELSDYTASLSQVNPPEYNAYTNSYFLFDDARFAGPNSYLNSLLTNANGPYGHPIFKQIRTSQNPLTRYHIANNIFSFVESPSREVVRNFGDNQIEYISSRYGDIQRFDEVPISSKYYPLQFLFGVGIDNERIENKEDLSIDNIERILLKSSYGNEMGYFVNDGINKYYSLSQVTEEDYEKIKEFYLNGGLDADDSPITTFEFMKYKETIFPREINTYKSHVRQRTNYQNNYWRDVRSDRSEIADNKFDSTISQSIWPLDAASDWATWSSIKLGYDNGDNGQDAGVLQNNYSLVSDNLSTFSPATINADLRPAPYYTRLHTLDTADSVVAPSGIQITEIMGPIFQGTALWEAGEQAGKDPFYSSYDYFIEELRGKGKDFSIVPEFRISDHVETLLQTGPQTKILDFFEVTGGLASSNQSSEATFYETYSTTDFLKHFAKIKKDHQDFAEPSTIKLTCKGLKKFLAYDSFYPAIRTKEMAEQFYDSYKDYIDISDVGGGGKPASNVRSAFMNLISTIYAPGTLYNSIKAGVACDYPIYTEQPGIYNTGDNYLLGDSLSSLFDIRIPFEATVEPEKYLSNILLFNNEPHPSGNISTSCFWDGNGDILYKKMASNFCAETSEFFLNNSSFTSITSLEQSNPNFGQAVAGTTYAMRVKMYRSMDSARLSFSGSSGPYMPPQDYIATGHPRETITMYSRPTAFGPPTSGFEGLAPTHRLDSRDGYNYPFTPPYYHGEAWADIEFTATTTKKYTVNEIISSANVKYYRADRQAFEDQAGGVTDVGPQASTSTGDIDENILNQSAMQLNSSLNLFSRGQTAQINLENDTSNQAVQITTDVTEDSATRWVIQTKFETPILNFKDVELTVSSSNLDSGQTPRGMWHQYGRLPTNEEGIYMAVENVPRTWLTNALGQSDEDAKLTGSLVDLCGFSSTPVKLGQVASGRVIREAVVAVPFIEIGGEKKFFELDANNVTTAREYLRVEDLNKKGQGVPPGAGDLESLAKRTSASVIDMVRKAKRYVFPPSMDFLNYPEVKPFSMYIFEFTHTLSQQDLADIWQNLPPSIGTSFEEAEASVTHPLLANELMGYGTGNDTTPKGGELPNKVRWMVFKVKQRANTNYFDKVVGVKGSPLAGQTTSRDQSLKVDQDLISYNWPYDFFSLVELVKIDAEVTFSDLENQDGTTKNVSKGNPKKEKSSRTIQQNPTLDSTRNNIGRRGR